MLPTSAGNGSCWGFFVSEWAPPAGLNSLKGLTLGFSSKVSHIDSHPVENILDSSPVGATVDTWSHDTADRPGFDPHHQPARPKPGTDAHTVWSTGSARRELTKQPRQGALAFKRMYRPWRRAGVGGRVVERRLRMRDRDPAARRRSCSRRRARVCPANRYVER
jgi:hypothetical protein